MKIKKNPKIILASSSLRRKEIMALAGLDFEAAPSCFDEDSLDASRISPRQFVKKLALGKARCLVPVQPAAIVIGADTIVVCDGRILGKPANNKEAVGILKLCRDKICDVLTGVAIINAETGRTVNFVDSTKVLMRNYDDHAIKDYVATGKPLQYAGAFAIQDRDWVESIEGSFFNVVGFPLLRVIEELEKFDVKVVPKKTGQIRRSDVYPCLDHPDWG